ncbi:hypothetical protein [Hymenobacter jejuensis]|uniref:Uncharacterized protein n=1 Tax=Hymenobacter jejuensis TaxID=2502781 RepID=A0A5B8A2M8_9BACT|nr:hypothetical protein [Hymenobacter jejuensis]QDA61419.1 hypothetical protein FHG12_15520 [Hymenobacter jejuensis]
MFFQKVVKGIANISSYEAQAIVEANGIVCNWWRNAVTITKEEIKSNLVDSNIFHHLNHYNHKLPSGHSLAHLGTSYGDVSPFISTTAGAIQRDAFHRRNILFDPFITALCFATNNFTASGFVFYAYLITLGKAAVALEQFAEEVRELHIYQYYLPYHHEGEIMAKVVIPSAQIEKAEEYDGPAVLRELKNRRKPVPISAVITNPAYSHPDDFINIRELL